MNGLIVLSLDGGMLLYAHKFCGNFGLVSESDEIMLSSSLFAVYQMSANDSSTNRLSFIIKGSTVIYFTELFSGPLNMLVVGFLDVSLEREFALSVMCKVSEYLSLQTFFAESPMKPSNKRALTAGVKEVCTAILQELFSQLCTEVDIKQMVVYHALVQGNLAATDSECQPERNAHQPNTFSHWLNCQWSQAVVLPESLCERPPLVALPAVEEVPKGKSSLPALPPIKDSVVHTTAAPQNPSLISQLFGSFRSAKAKRFESLSTASTATSRLNPVSTLSAPESPTISSTCNALTSLESPTDSSACNDVIRYSYTTLTKFEDVGVQSAPSSSSSRSLVMGVEKLRSSAAQPFGFRKAFNHFTCSRQASKVDLIAADLNGHAQERALDSLAREMIVWEGVVDGQVIAHNSVLTGGTATDSQLVQVAEHGNCVLVFSGHQPPNTDEVGAKSSIDLSLLRENGLRIAQLLQWSRFCLDRGLAPHSDSFAVEVS